jgi:hypothetical protein
MIGGQMHWASRGFLAASKTRETADEKLKGSVIRPLEQPCVAGFAEWPAVWLLALRGCICSTCPWTHAIPAAVIFSVFDETKLIPRSSHNRTLTEEEEHSIEMLACCTCFV